jgi:hypothetical protein
MKSLFMRQSAMLPLLFMLGGAPLALSAQEATVMPTPKILVIQREYTKPGKDGASHEKTEGAYIHALSAGKAHESYIALTSLTGPSRALFMSSYPSFAAWEEDHKNVGKDAALSAALDRANVADGDLLSATDSSVWSRREDLSLNPGWRVGRTTRCSPCSPFAQDT